MSLLRRISDFWARLFPGKKRHSFARVFVIQSGAATPAHPTPAEVVLIRSGTRDKWLRFSCPDGCGMAIMLDLSPTRRPHWWADLHDDGTISVYPSVVNKECGAHFIVRKSRITWVR